MTNRAMLTVSLLASCLLDAPCVACQTPAAMATSTSNCIAYIGVWDRAQPMLAEQTLAVGLTPIFANPQDVLEEHSANAKDVAKCSVVFVLNMTTANAIGLRGFFEAIDSSGRMIFALDERASHADLKSAGVLTADNQIQEYWRNNGDINISRLLHYVLVRYMGAKGNIDPPLAIPEAGYYDPEHESEAITTLAAYKAFKAYRGRWKQDAPVVALLTQQSFWITHDTKVLSAEVFALERHGLNPVVIFGDRQHDIADMLAETHPAGIIEDRHGAMWDSRDLLERLDVPYFRPISMLADTIDEWKADPQGLSFRDVGLFMTLQESWGTIEPVVVGGLHASILGLKMHDPVPDGIERFAARVASTIRLRTKLESEKKIAIVFPNAGTGLSELMRGSPTGMFLNGPASAMEFLPELSRRGFTVRDIPKDVDELMRQMRQRAYNVGSWNSQQLDELVQHGDPILVPAEEYDKWFHEKLSVENQKRMIDAYGPAPGKFMVIEKNHHKFIVLPHLQFGNIILMPQPARGQTEDYTLVHSRDVPPPHNYLAFYWWLQESFKADAVIHWGTHGTLEMLPGKEAGMTRDDWTDICIGNMPNIDLWIMDNLAEASLARRRSYAVLVDHMVPPTVNAGLEDQYRSISDDIDKFNALEHGMIREKYRVRISDASRRERIDQTLKFQDTQQPLTDDQIKIVASYLEQLSEAKAPLILHILGRPPEEKYLASYLTSIGGTSFIKHLEAASPPDHVISDSRRRSRLRKKGEALMQTAVIDHRGSELQLTADLKKDVESGTEMLSRIKAAGEEMDGLFRALDGHYVRPGPGPDPIRNPASLPAGRNLYALNPEEIPTRPAWDTAVALVDSFLKDHKLHKVGIDLNGMDSMRDFGVTEAQILYLMGVEPVWDRNGLAIDVQLIPRARLGRPRIDVFIAMGGMYKENFRTRVELIDKAVRLASAADEADNYVRIGTLANRRRFEQAGASADAAATMATARIFGTKPGDMSGTNILYLVPNTGYWHRDSELTDVYIDHMSYVYTKGMWGTKVPGLYEQNIQGTEALIRVWASNMSSELSNHHAYEYLGGLSMAVKQLTGKEPPAFIADVRDPDGARMRDFDEVLQTDFRTQLLNPHWVEGMKQHGYAGAGQVSELVTNTFGWAVTREGSISDATWNEISAVYFDDKYKLGTREWLERDNPHAMEDLAGRLIEASRRGLWKADPRTLHQLSQLWQALVQKYGASGGQLGANNPDLKQYIARLAGESFANTPGSAPGLVAPNIRALVTVHASLPALKARSTVTGQLLAFKQETMPESETRRAAITSTPLNCFVLFVSALSFLTLLSAGFAGRRGAL